MEMPNTSAGRLRSLLERIAAHEKQKSRPIKEVWAMIFEYPKKDVYRIFTTLAAAGDLVVRVHDDVQQIPDMNHEPYLTWVPKTKAAFEITNLDTQFSQVLKHIDTNVISLVSICEERLQRHMPDPPVDYERYRSVKTQAEELYEEVSADASIPSYLKDYILKHLEIILRALDDWVFYGPRALRDGLERAYGAARVRDRRVGNPKGGGYSGRLMKIVAAYVLLTQGIINTDQIATEPLQALPGFSEGLSEPPATDAAKQLPHPDEAAPADLQLPE